jgi:hypothetical protein
MDERHTKELESQRRKLEETISLKPKDSAELLNLKKIQNNLAK